MLDPSTKVLALDLATSTGFAFGAPGGTVTYGTLRLPGTGADHGTRLVRLYDWLCALHTIENLGWIVFEGQFAKGPSDSHTAYFLMTLGGTVQLFGAYEGIRTSPANIHAWKKLFTGNGRARKGETKEVAKRMGWKPKNFDEADALGIWSYQVSQLWPDLWAERVRRAMSKERLL